jgi:hypothetical protein
MSFKGSNAYATKNQDKPIIRFRIKAALFLVVVVFVLCFAIYMAEANLTSKKLNSEGFSADTSVLADVQATEPAVDYEEKQKKIINPVPASVSISISIHFLISLSSLTAINLTRIWGIPK